MTLEEAFAALEAAGLAIYTINGPTCYSAPGNVWHVNALKQTPEGPDLTRFHFGRADTLIDAIISAINYVPPAPAPYVEYTPTPRSKPTRNVEDLDLD